MQCPSTEEIRGAMYTEFEQYDNQIDGIFLSKPQEVFNWLNGKPIEDLDADVLYGFWQISGKYICNIYRQSCMRKDKIGIG